MKKIVEASIPGVILAIVAQLLSVYCDREDVTYISKMNGLLRSLVIFIVLYALYCAGCAIYKRIKKYIKERKKIETTKPYSSIERNYEIIGRKTEIAEIEAAIISNNVLIYGFGGIGKTTIAEKVYNEICENYEVSACITYNRCTKDSLLNGLKWHVLTSNTALRFNEIMEDLRSKKRY